jgi:hypothetical protein
MIVLTNFNVGVLSDKTLTTRDAGGRLFRYDGGVYTENGDLYVKR